MERQKKIPQKNGINIKISKYVFYIMLSTFFKNAKFIIFFGVFLGIIISLAGAGYIYSFPLKARAKIEFSIAIDRKNNKYPNGSTFNINDILATNILLKVYKQDNLHDYFDDFDEFKSSLFVYRNDIKLMFLEEDYTKKLKNQDITPAVKAALESEYLRKRSQIVNNSNFIIGFASAKSPSNLPQQIMIKFLSDILNTWLEASIKDRGINKYNISLYSRDTINKSTLLSLDYVMGIDLLRSLLRGVKENIDAIGELPGANLTNLTCKLGSFTYSDLKLKYQFLNDYQLEPLIGIIKSYALDQNQKMQIIYLENKLITTEEKLKFVTQERGMLQELANKFLLKSDLDLINTTKREVNIKKDIQYYQRMINAYNTKSIKISERKHIELEAEIKEKELTLLSSINELIFIITEFYSKLSANNLGIRSDYIKPIAYMANISRGINSRQIITVCFIVWLGLMLFIIGIIYYNAHIVPEIKKIKDMDIKNI